MGFYIRKGINFGPIRLNLSRSGLGASFGVKGARLGIGPKGRYVHVGRHGLYYRQQLSDSQVPQEHNLQSKPVISDRIEEIESANIAQLTDESSKDLLDELNRIQRRIEWFPFVLIGSICILLYLLAVNFSDWLILIYFIVATVCVLYVRHMDVMKTTAILNYDLEKDVQKNFAGLVAKFKALMNCKGKWHIEAAGNASDWKRSGGANQTVRRRKTTLMFSKPRRVVCNIDMPVFGAGKQQLYFFPDRILVFEKRSVGAVSYDELEVGSNASQFIEEEPVPTDAQIVDTTWKYVNKKGGPDLRFRDNKELPIALYGQLHLKSPSGLNEKFNFSVPEICNGFAKELEDYCKFKYQ